MRFEVAAVAVLTVAMSVTSVCMNGAAYQHRHGLGVPDHHTSVLGANTRPLYGTLQASCLSSLHMPLMTCC